MTTPPSPFWLTLPNTPSSVKEVAKEISSQLKQEQLIDFVCELIAQGLPDSFINAEEIFAIASTESAFENEKKIKVLESVAQDCSIRNWIQQQAGKETDSITRNDLQSWWHYFTQMAATRGYQPEEISHISQKSNLWRATRNLAIKMNKQKDVYAFLPPYLTNIPRQVAGALKEINEPIPFLEILTGETWEDMCKSSIFLSAFCLQNTKNAEENAIASVMLVLQRF